MTNKLFFSLNGYEIIFQVKNKKNNKSEILVYDLRNFKIKFNIDLENENAKFGIDQKGKNIFIADNKFKIYNIKSKYKVINKKSNY